LYELDDKGIKDSNIATIIADIEEHHQWKRPHRQFNLFLNKNQISEEGCKLISRATFDNLRYLNLGIFDILQGDNKINDLGCKYLAKGIWPKMCTLFLSKISIDLRQQLYHCKRMQIIGQRQMAQIGNPQTM